jgi:spore germination cell wall hydrolase CwlJ-like protein
MRKAIIILIMILALGTKSQAHTINREDKALEYDYNEILLLERLTMSETSLECYECKVATAVTVLKRAKMYNKSLSDVIYEPYQYSLADNGTPTAEVKRAVLEAIQTESDYPDSMIYFRAYYYHDFGTPYKQIGGHYFSLAE